MVTILVLCGISLGMGRKTSGRYFSLANMIDPFRITNIIRCSIDLKKLYCVICPTRES